MKLKRLCGDLIAACISILILCSWMVLPFEAQPEVPGPVPYTAPSDGAGRGAAAETEDDPCTYTPETETAEIDAYIALETEEEKENETICQFTEVYPVVEEEYVEVLSDLDPIIYTDIDALIVEAAERYNLPWQLVSAVCYAESNYNPYAVSSTPDYGLMQITESVLDAYGLTDWSDPAQNLDVGCRILREKLDLSDGDFTMALTRYRFGDAEALAMWSRGEWSNWYSERVLGKYYELLRGEH